MLCCRFEPEGVEDSDEERVLRKKALQVMLPLSAVRDASSCFPPANKCEFIY